jgi:hypothetical protein
MRSFLLLAAVVLIAAAVAGCGGETAIRSGEEASHYIDDVLRGVKDPSAFKLADGATPVARAALADAQPLSEMQRLVDEAPDATCTAAGIISTASGAKPESPEAVTLDPAGELQARNRARDQGVPDSVRDRVFHAALQMAQSTLVDAAAKACTAAQTA